MNALDWVLIGIVILTTLRGLWRGAISQVFSIAGMIGGFWIASEYYQSLGGQLATAFPKLSASQAGIAAFVAIYLLAWFLFAVVGFWISRLFRRTGLGFLDRTGGGLIGVLKGILLSIILLSVLTVFLSPRHRIIAGSQLAPYVNASRDFIAKFVPKKIQSLLKSSEEELKQLRDKSEKPINPAHQNEKAAKSADQ
jgi:membrane protein required for colicin V production